MIDREELEAIEERIDDHVQDPYHRGPCPGCTHAHEGDNPLCGDRVRLELQVDGSVVREIYFSGRGCRISQASASMLAEELEGKTLEDVRHFTPEAMLRLFGARLTPNRQKCCLLPWRVLQSALYSPTREPAPRSAPERQPGGEPRAVASSKSGEGDGPVHVSPDPQGPLPLPSRLASQSPDGRARPSVALEHVRDDFALFARRQENGQSLAYLDNAATTQRPRQVIEAIVDAYENHSANIHRGIHRLAEEATALYEESRRALAGFLHASSTQEVIFTSGTTAGINLVARSWGDAYVSAGDEILVTEMEHHSNLVPWHQLAQRSGAVIRYIPLTEDGRLELGALDRLLNRRTRLVAVTAVSNVLGTINPIEHIIRRAHDAGAVVLVDGAQSVPHQAVDVIALDCDFLAFSGHKMLGPTGIGVLYGKRAILEKMPPFLGGGGMIQHVRVDAFEPACLGDESDPRPARFEAGTPPIAEAIGLRAAVDYLSRLGMETVSAHERELTVYAHELLSAIPGLRILGPEPEAKTGIVSFTLRDAQGRPVHGHDVAEGLDKRGIAVRASHHCAEPLHRRYGVDATVRASFYLYNTRDEVDRLAEAIEWIRDGALRTG